MTAREVDPVVTCSACAAENQAGARFCAQCGTPLVPRCPACGAEHRPDQRFCDQCGTALGTTLDTAPAPVADVVSVAERRVVSVLFVDLVGYTTLSESRDPEDVRELLSGYFDTARTIVGRYGGTIEKFIGDAVMAVWGTPVAREDDAELAVRAALELVDAVEAFGESAGVPQLRARAGVVTGQVASLAADGEGLVVGDRVNTAARVQAAAGPGTVLVDEVTRQAAAAAIVFEDAGEHTVKGKEQALRLWRAARVVAGVAGAHREQGLVAPFVGREVELRMVKELFHAAADRGTARLVAVSGPAGVGKTRLRREFEIYVDGLADTVFWHSGRCLSYGEGVAYWALTEMVRQRLGIPEESPPEDAARRLALGLEQWVPDAEERAYLTPRIGALLGTAEVGFERQELFAGWRLFFERLSGHRPVVLVFEDLHRADEGLLDFVEHLLTWSAQRPIFVLALARPELVERRVDWARGRPGVTPMFLEPLADAAIGELLGGLVSGLPQPVAERIVAQAEGIPLYALETVRALADRGALAETGEGGLEVVGEVGELEVPATLSSLLTARLDALSLEERTLVKRLAVLGGSFPLHAVLALTELSEPDAQGLLASLVAKQVLVVRADPLSPDTGHYAFAQTLLRTVAADLLSRRERGPLHLAAARHLRSAFPNDGEDVAEAIAAHLLDAYRATEGDAGEEELRDEAIAALVRAAQRAASVGAPDVALRAYRTAIELAADERRWTELGEAAGAVAVVAGQHQAAIDLYDAAAAAHLAAGRPDDAARTTVDKARALRIAGRSAEALELLQPALAALDPNRVDAHAAALLSEVAGALVIVGRHEEAGPLFDRALQTAEALELPLRISNLLSLSGMMYGFRGQYEMSRSLYAGSIAYAERLGDTLAVTTAKSNLGSLDASRDRDGGAEQCRDAVALARRLGSRSWLCLACGNLLYCLLQAGEWDEMLRVAAEPLAAEEFDQPAADLHAHLAVLSALRGDRDAAARHLRGVTPWQTGDDIEMRAGYAAAAGAVALAEGRFDEALEHTGVAVREELTTIGASQAAIRLAWPDAVVAALALGRVDVADGFVGMLAALPIGHVPPLLRAELRRARGLVAAARGEHDDVEVDLRAAVDDLAALGYPFWVARAESDLAAWLLGQGRGDEATGILDDAVAAFRALGAAPALVRAQGLRAGKVAPTPLPAL